MGFPGNHSFKKMSQYVNLQYQSFFIELFSLTSHSGLNWAIFKTKLSEINLLQTFYHHPYLNLNVT